MDGRRDMKKTVLFLILLAGLNVGLVYAHTFDNTVIWLSEAGGGNITFIYDFEAATFTQSSNQIRFTQWVMNHNGTWAAIGFRNPDPNSTLIVARASADYLKLNCSVDADGTTFEIYAPRGEPETITGGNFTNWASNTQSVTMLYNGTIVLTWSDTEPTASDVTVSGVALEFSIPLFFQNVISLVFTVFYMMLQYRRDGLLWRCLMGILVFVCWYSTAQLTVFVFPAQGLATGLLYYGFALLAAVYTFIDVVALVQKAAEGEPDPWF